jgi:hypothetical protein
MTSTSPIVDEAEQFVRRLAEQATRPRENECLCCYVARQLDEFSCDGSHRHALRYRDAMAPRATALRERLSELGACCCDCELFMNGYELRTAEASHDQSLFGPVEDDHIEPGPEVVPPCQGVRRGSVRPCGNWVRVRRR